MDFVTTTEHSGPDVARLIDTHSAMLYRLCRNLTYSKEDAEDLFQETWCDVLRKPQKLQDAKSPQSFLCQAALYLWKSEKRKYARRKRIAPVESHDLEIPSEQNLEQDLLQQTEKELVQRLVEDLPEKFRIPLVLHYTLEMDIAEIAKTLGLPTGTVKSRLFYARKEIEKGWKKHENA